MSAAANMIVGGFTKVRLVTKEVKDICIKVKSQMEKKTGFRFKDFIPILYKSQVVAGINYLVKVVVSQEDGVEEDKCVHVLIFQALDCNGGKLSVTRVQTHKTIMDPLNSF
ncbi:hypothetical protein R3I93_002596 [Phoxinus phoxinus]|uniref:Cystatin-B n=1 Tax=Phoxinus phoxinus TaxID=58324 RepID=A0AAN9DJQ2_9TELE